VPDGTVRILSVSRLDRGDRYKGINLTLEALSLLGDTVPRIEYAVIGDGNDRDHLEGMTRDLGLAGRVRFLGNVSDGELAAAYEACDLFALPSTHEGLGIVYLEAMARGKPVVAVRAGGVADAVVHEANGLLLREPSAPALADALFRLATDWELRNRLGAWGCKHTVPLFSVDRMKTALAQIVGVAPPRARLAEVA
jgi:glycosyltransferase involved in cell wall biosynthesis